MKYEINWIEEEVQHWRTIIEADAIKDALDKFYSGRNDDGEITHSDCKGEATDVTIRGEDDGQATRVSKLYNDTRNNS